MPIAGVNVIMQRPPPRSRRNQFKLDAAHPDPVANPEVRAIAALCHGRRAGVETDGDLISRLRKTLAHLGRADAADEGLVIRIITHGHGDHGTDADRGAGTAVIRRIILENTGHGNRTLSLDFADRKNDAAIVTNLPAPRRRGSGRR